MSKKIQNTPLEQSLFNNRYRCAARGKLTQGSMSFIGKLSYSSLLLRVNIRSALKLSNLMLYVQVDNFL